MNKNDKNDNNKVENNFKENAENNGSDISDESKKNAEYENVIKKLQDLLVREKAENENIRKRFKRELEDAHKFAITNFAKDVIEQIENLFRALENVKEDACNSNKDLKALYEGVVITKDNILKSFAAFDIHRIYPLNEVFDHKFHQVISQIVDNDKKPNTIINVVQAGYSIKNRLLKPATVIVSKKDS